MRKLAVNTLAFVLLTFTYLTIRPSFTQEQPRAILLSIGSISYTANTPFSSRGTVVCSNTLHPDAKNYQRNGWAILQDLGINVIDVRGGGEGDIWRWNMGNYPDDWAANLDSFLSLADAIGIKVVFSLLGTEYGTMFGIQCPEPAKGIVGTTVAEAKSMIDKLAGNNKLSHNFVDDSRIIAWSPANEIDIGDLVTRDWVLQMLDYLKSKGAAQVFVSCPINYAYSSEWTDATSLQATEPILRGHVDYLCFHTYAVALAMQTQDSGGDVYSVMYNQFHSNLQEHCINGKGTTPVDKIILGEFGLWQGYGSSMGATGTFTEETRGAYYQAVYQACTDLGIRHIFNYYSFPDTQPNYEIVSANGAYYTACTSVLQQYYK